jgi:hypothetical protein
MKKMRLTVILAMVLALALVLGLMTVCLAASFPGATVALKWDKDADTVFVLTLKKNGNVKMASAVKFYEVSGAMFWPGSPSGGSLSGSAYVFGSTGSQHLHFHLTGAFSGTFMDLQGSINQQSGTGGVIAHYSGASSWGTSWGIYNLTVLNAKEIETLPYPGP